MPSPRLFHGADVEFFALIDIKQKRRRFRLMEVVAIARLRRF